jgi:ATP-dependent DNA helicase RecG
LKHCKLCVVKIKPFEDSNHAKILNYEQIKALLAQGENSAVEYKSALVSADSLAKEMVAFANLNGGVILIGIEDDKTITGVTDQTKMEELITAVSRNNVYPPVQPHISFCEIEQKNVMCIEIPKGPDKPYQTNKHLYYIRVGSTNRIATQTELMRLFQQAGVFHFDAAGVEGTNINDLNLNKLDQYFERYNIGFTAEPDKERLLRNADILTDNGQVTVAGSLIFGINPQRRLHSAYISFAHFAGSIISDVLIDKQDITGNLDDQIDTTLAIIKNNLLTPSIIEGTKRVNTRYQYPDKIFRELLVNACAHRNYAIAGSQIRVFMFDDRLEIHSPGKLPNAITPEKLIVGVTQAINPIVVKFLHHLLYIDKLGRGIPLVYQEATKHQKSLTFEELGETFIVRLEL